MLSFKGKLTEILFPVKLRASRLLADDFTFEPIEIEAFELAPLLRFEKLNFPAIRVTDSNCLQKFDRVAANF